MEEPKSNKNQAHAENEDSKSYWEFFIAKEEMSEKLNARYPDEHTHSTNENGKKRWIVRFFAESNATDWAITFLTAGMLVVGYWQWTAINGQLGEMKAAGKQTDQLICLYSEQVAKLTEQVGILSKTAGIADKSEKDFVRSMQIQFRPYVLMRRM